jgi:hypothetical protein
MMDTAKYAYQALLFISQNKANSAVTNQALAVLARLSDTDGNPTPVESNELIKAIGGVKQSPAVNKTSSTSQGVTGTAHPSDGDGFVAVSQFPKITQTEVIKNKRLCTTLILPQLTDPAQIARVKLNCQAATRANASRAAVPGSFSWHNTAYDVKSDGKGGYVINTDISAVMPDNTVIPDDTALTDAAVTAYANTLPLFVEQQKTTPMVPGQK